MDGLTLQISLICRRRRASHFVRSRNEERPRSHRNDNECMPTIVRRASYRSRGRLLTSYGRFYARSHRSFRYGAILKGRPQICGFLVLLPPLSLVRIQTIIPIVNPRNVSYFVFFSTIPLPLSVRTSLKYHPKGDSQPQPPGPPRSLVHVPSTPSTADA